jgi:hypothetical protein
MERHFASLEPEMSRRSGQNGSSCRRAGRAEPMAEILGISGEPVKACDDGQTE